MTSEMELVVGCDGGVRCIYDEALDLLEIGKLQITRASHVEPDRDGFWWADMGPVDGPVLGPFKNRTEALGAERGWLLAAGPKVASLPTQAKLEGAAPPGGVLLFPFAKGEEMNSRRLLCMSIAATVFALLPISAFADKISTQDFEELKKGSKMSEVIAAVGQPGSKKAAPPVYGGMIEWHYPNIPSALNGKPVYVKLFFDKNTERLETMGIY